MKWAYASLLVGTVGQFVWAAIFWNSHLFMHHWTVGIVGWSIGIIGLPFIAQDMKKMLGL